ncbi:MAG: GntR family transcriptional regulator with LacI sensor [Anaerocolumna sp.]|jgi:GntR family transcriptional regulator of arabinose operon|nr:GntR family transcriptional regulator with LacI sensor [Anaerocolumna sp.]
MTKNEQSKHSVLSQWIKENVANGNFSVGERIPSENELAKKFGYSRQTVRQAIGTLVSEGILVREQGSGTYVSILNRKSSVDKTMRIGVITTYLDDYVFPSIIHGIEEILTEAGYTMSLGITHNKPRNEENCLQQMIQSGVDGIIIEGTKSALPNANEKLYQKLKEIHIPTVFINGYYNNYSDSYIVMDDAKSGELATDVLIQNGHKHIGGIFKSDDLQGLKRYEGILKSIKKHNFVVDDTSIIWYTTEDFNYLFEGSMDTVILDRIKDITGIVCYNDQVASALIRLLKRNNLSVPDNYSIVSFDNSFLAKEMVCNLTSVIYPSNKIGKKAAQLILKQINNPLIAERIKIEPSIKLRNSVKKLNI